MKIEKLRFENVCYAFDQTDPVLKNTDFDFPMNEVCWIQSEEGQGKSTLLQVMAGLQMPQIGSYLINDISISEMSFEEFLPYRIKIGYSFDYGGLISNRSLRDNLLLPLQYHKLLPENEAQKRVDELIEMFDFKKQANERPAHVPGRLRKLTCLLRSLVHRPDLLVLDDPFVGLGTEASEIFLHLVQDLRDKGALQHMMVVSFDDNYMRKLNPKILHLDDGQLYLSVVDAGKSVANL